MTISKWNHNFLAFYSGIRNSRNGETHFQNNKQTYTNKQCDTRVFSFRWRAGPRECFDLYSFWGITKKNEEEKQISNRLWQYLSKKGGGVPSTPLSEKNKWPPSRDHYHHHHHIGHSKVLNQNHQSTANVWQILPTSKYVIRSTCTVDLGINFLNLAKVCFELQMVV